jgi:BirA family transcriptional regulator, biotin operon repressor / biotin---[acetyl-CoA-carboxylase] ligase
LKSNLPDELRDSHEVPPDVMGELRRVSDRLGALAHRVHWLATTGSTNDVAARLADLGAEEGTVVVAEAQTAGRGRHGRAWFSPRGAGLYVSLVLRPSGTRGVSSGDNPAALLTIAAGVAIAEGIRAATGLPAEIKWPNDVVIGGRKLAGILAEAVAQAGWPPIIVVVGFGVNVQPAAYPPELAARATSIEAETNRPADRAVVLAEILAAMAERYADLRSGRFDAILSAWRGLARSLVAARVEWDGPAGVIRGCAEGVDDRGALLVRVGDRVERIVAGEVRWI